MVRRRRPKRSSPTIERRIGVLSSLLLFSTSCVFDYARCHVSRRDRRELDAWHMFELVLKHMLGPSHAAVMWRHA